MAYKRIALLLPQDFSYGRDIMRGVAAYARDLTQWEFREAPPHKNILSTLRKWKPHGIIAHIVEKPFERALAKLAIPVVNTTLTLPHCAFPCVDADHEAVGELAAAYFLERGFKHFAYYGSQQALYSQLRESCYRERIKAAGYSVSSSYAEYMPRPPLDEAWLGYDHALRSWLQGLPRPCAIFVSNDYPARKLIETCRSLGIHIPTECAVLGVDNDSAECSLCNPALSSMSLPTHEIGYQAAGWLDAWLRSGCAPKQSFMGFAPKAVLTRQSTDTLASADERLSRAFAYILQHAHKDITVEDVARAIGVSRRVLEKIFRKELGMSILDAIQRAHLDIARRLMEQGQMDRERIAAASGMGNARRMQSIIKRYN